MLSEDKSEDEAEHEANTEYEVRWLHHFIDCVSAMDVIAQLSLPWLKQHDNRLHISMTLRDMRTIRMCTRDMKHRMRAALRESFGDASTSELKCRHGLLWTKIADVLVHMPPLGQEASPASSEGKVKEASSAARAPDWRPYKQL